MVRDLQRFVFFLAAAAFGLYCSIEVFANWATGRRLPKVSVHSMASKRAAVFFGATLFGVFKLRY